MSILKGKAHVHISVHIGGGSFDGWQDDCGFDVRLESPTVLRDIVTAASDLIERTMKRFLHINARYPCTRCGADTINGTLCLTCSMTKFYVEQVENGADMKSVPARYREAVKRELEKD